MGASTMGRRLARGRRASRRTQGGRIDLTALQSRADQFLSDDVRPFSWTGLGLTLALAALVVGFWGLVIWGGVHAHRP